MTANVPVAGNETASVAVPFVRGAVPSVLPPATKETVPVGVAPVTVAVRVSC